MEGEREKEGEKKGERERSLRRTAHTQKREWVPETERNSSQRTEESRQSWRESTPATDTRYRAAPAPATTAAAQVEPVTCQWRDQWPDIHQSKANESRFRPGKMWGAHLPASKSLRTLGRFSSCQQASGSIRNQCPSWEEPQAAITGTLFNECPIQVPFYCHLLRECAPVLTSLCLQCVGPGTFYCASSFISPNSSALFTSFDNLISYYHFTVSFNVNLKPRLLSGQSTFQSNQTSSQSAFVHWPLGILWPLLAAESFQLQWPYFECLFQQVSPHYHTLASITLFQVLPKRLYSSSLQSALRFLPWKPF